MAARVSTDILATRIAIGLALQTLMTMALTAWGRWVSRRQGATPTWTWAARGPWISFAALMLGMAISIRMLLVAFERVANVEAGQRAVVLSQSIAHAMIATAVFFVPGYLVLLASVTAFIVGSLRAPRDSA